MKVPRWLAWVVIATLVSFGVLISTAGRSLTAFSVDVEPRMSTTNVTWTESQSPQRPPAVAEHSMVYDVRSNRVILFGGYTDQPIGETWVYDPVGDSWTNRTSAMGPPARSLAAMAYDAESDRVILFGGAHVGLNLDDTWAYDYRNNTWTNLNPVLRPTGRTGHSMTYDNRSDRVIMFGGYIGSSIGETWAYDFKGNNWTAMNPAVAPSSRGLNAIAYDQESDRVVMFGGSFEKAGSSITLFRETWTYDVGANLWSRMNPPVSPSARAWLGTAYDSQSDRTVLFGGIDNNGSNGETWFYDVNRDAWARAIPVASPSARTGHALAYDVQSDRVVLFGGRTPNGASDETWALGTAPPDISPPIIRIEAPGEGAIVDSSTVVVHGTASDNRGVARVEARSDASDWIVATGTTTWSVVLTVPLGQNSIHVRAFDASGNAGTATVAVTIVPLSTVAFVVAAVASIAFAAWFAWRIRKARKQDPLRKFRGA